jgi:hypothetical protein
VLMRQLTGGMQYIAAEPPADWELPAGVELARFSDGQRESLLLYSQSYRAVSVRVPPSAEHYSLARVDPGGYLRIVPGPHDAVVVDRTPAILYYEY